MLVLSEWKDVGCDPSGRKGHLGLTLVRVYHVPGAAVVKSVVFPGDCAQLCGRRALLWQVSLVQQD